jgi:hypothetical protein
MTPRTFSRRVVSGLPGRSTSGSFDARTTMPAPSSSLTPPGAIAGAISTARRTVACDCAIQPAMTPPTLSPTTMTVSPRPRANGDAVVDCLAMRDARDGLGVRRFSRRGTRPDLDRLPHTPLEQTQTARNEGLYDNSHDGEPVRSDAK